MQIAFDSIPEDRCPLMPSTDVRTGAQGVGITPLCYPMYQLRCWQELSGLPDSVALWRFSQEDFRKANVNKTPAFALRNLDAFESFHN